MAERELANKLSSGEITQMKIGGTASTDIVPTIGEVDAAYQDIAGDNVVTKTKYDPLATHPSHVEGQTFYCDVEKTLAVQTDISGLHIHLPTDSPIRVINKTGAEIPALSAIRNGGIDATSSKIKAELAQSDALTTSFVIGITPVAIPIDGESWVLSNGVIHNVDTSLLAVGGTLFLSDTAAGGLIQTIPDIACALGTVQVSSATVGEIFVKIDNLITYPQVTGILRGQNAPIYNVTTASQDIINFTQSIDIILDADALLGTFTIPIDGHYQITFTSIPEFASSPSTRTLYFELYNETTSTALGSYPRNIPKDATEEGMSFTAPIIDAVSGHVYKMRVKASLDLIVTFNSMAFLLTSNYLG